MDVDKFCFLVHARNGITNINKAEFELSIVYFCIADLEWSVIISGSHILESRCSCSAAPSDNLHGDVRVSQFSSSPFVCSKVQKTFIIVCLSIVPSGYDHLTFWTNSCVHFEV